MCDATPGGHAAAMGREADDHFLTDWQDNLDDAVRTITQAQVALMGGEPVSVARRQLEVAFNRLESSVTKLPEAAATRARLVQE